MRREKDFDSYLKANRPRPEGDADQGLQYRIWRQLELESGSSTWWLRAAIPAGVATLALLVQLWLGASTVDPSDLRLAADVEWAFMPMDSEDGDIADPAGDFLEIAGGI